MLTGHNVVFFRTPQLAGAQKMAHGSLIRQFEKLPHTDPFAVFLRPRLKHCVLKKNSEMVSEQEFFTN